MVRRTDYLFQTTLFAHVQITVRNSSEEVCTPPDTSKIPTHCLLLFATPAGDLLDSVKFQKNGNEYKLRGLVMKVKVAETAGFCFGVKRAVDKVYELIDTEQKPIFTLGPIIHNEGVVADLEAKGVHVITEADLDSPDDNLQNGTVVIRSHGVGKSSLR